MRLSRADLEGALAFVREAGELHSTEPFPSALLDRLASVVRSDSVSYCEIDRMRRDVTFLTGSASHDAPEAPEEVYWATVHEHPIRNHRRRTGELRALKIFDFVTPTQLRRTQFYADFIAEWATPFMMTLGLPARRGSTRTFIFGREARDFTERERTVLDLLQPHLLQIRRGTDTQRRAPQRLAADSDALLTLREVEVIAHVAEGLRNRQIAEALSISSGTVRRHLDNIYGKLDAHTRTEAVRVARERGALAEPDSRA